MGHDTDEELIRQVLSDAGATMRERSMAFRLFSLIESHDAMEDIMLGVKPWEGRIH